MTEGEEVGVEVGVEDDVVREEDEVELDETPVDRLTLCRLKRAMASSMGSAATEEARRAPKARTMN